MARFALFSIIAALLVFAPLCPAAGPVGPTTEDANQAAPTSRPAAASQPATASEAAFLLVDVTGAIGRDFTSFKMSSAIAEARKQKLHTIVLHMDTPGGSVPDAEETIDLIIENKDLRFVALVTKALSAGAAITLACREIYVTEQATIGAAVSYVPDKNGRPMQLPADVAEKMQSAWRAVCRKAADHGGHPSLLAEGMVDKDFAIYMRKQDGKVVLERVGGQSPRRTQYASIFRKRPAPKPPVTTQPANKRPTAQSQRADSHSHGHGGRRLSTGRRDRRRRGGAGRAHRDPEVENDRRAGRRWAGQPPRAATA